LNEFWGKRYHRILRAPLLFWAKPFSVFGKEVHYFAVFGMSALWHIAMYYPLARKVSFWPPCCMFLGQAFGILFERYLFKRHGIRVGGWWGRIWGFTWFSIVAIPMTIQHHEWGWPGMMPRDYTLQPSFSGVEWLLYAVGLPSRLGRR